MFHIAFFSFALLAAAVPAFAEERFAVRATALQGGIASPKDNASIYLNPAGVGIVPRYDLSGFGRLTQGTPDRLFGVSLVDSKSSPELGAGVAWVRDTGDTIPQDDFAVAVSQKYGVGALGFAGHYRIDRDRKKRTDLNLDSGFVIDPWSEWFKIGLVFYNMLDAPNGVKNVRRKYALGLASKIGELLEITADGAYTAGLPEVWEWSAGVDVFALQYVSFIAGFGQGPIGPNREERLSGGITAGIPGDFRLGYAYLRQLGKDGPATHSAELSMYFF